jgi:hypothetical protein
MKITITATFALLDVLKSCAALNKHIDKTHYLPDDTRLPVVIKGFISHRPSTCNGTSKEFGIDVVDMVTGPEAET